MAVTTIICTNWRVITVLQPPAANKVCVAVLWQRWSVHVPLPLSCGFLAIVGNTTGNTPTRASLWLFWGVAAVGVGGGTAPPVVSAQRRRRPHWLRCSGGASP